MVKFRYIASSILLFAIFILWFYGIFETPLLIVGTAYFTFYATRLEANIKLHLLFVAVISLLSFIFAFRTNFQTATLYFIVFTYSTSRFVHCLNLNAPSKLSSFMRPIPALLLLILLLHPQPDLRYAVFFIPFWFIILLLQTYMDDWWWHRCGD